MSDTICAIATSMNTSAIGIIRLSGSDAVEIADKVFSGNKKLRDTNTHTINYGHIVDNEKIIDEVLVSLMRAPRSYTTEDVVEINCHGGPFVLKKVLGLLIENGARLAEPGEFTKRAFLNGRIDLSEAEAVMNLIASDNEMARSNSIRQLSGALNNNITKLRDSLIHESAYIEAALDDPEHYDLSSYPQFLREKLLDILNNVDNLIKSFDNGAVYREGISTAIVGKPNAGKSSVMNLLSNSDKAIVTDIAGTTRDIIEQSIILNDININLIDTAGIREANDLVEQIGVDKSFSMIDDASLCLYVVDSSIPLDDNDYQIIDKLRNKKVIILFNKTDLVTVVDKSELLEKLNCAIIDFSAKDIIFESVKELANTISNMFISGEILSDNEIYITSSRQKQCLVDCKNSIERVITAIDDQMTEDFFTIDLMDAYTSLGLITGESIEDDLADRIFAEFCMGK